MKSRTLLLLFFISGLGISSYSQSDFREGFVITLENDTIHGLVNFREGSKSYRFCDFKTSEGAQVYTYSPDQLIGYGFVNDKFFIVKEVIVGGSAKTEFVQLLVGGLVNLYKYEALYFVSKADGELIQLSNDQIEVVVDSKSGVKNTNNHIGILNMLMFDCVNLRPKIQQARIQEKFLTNLVRSYNLCNGETPSIVYQDKKLWFKGNVSLLVGTNISNLIVHEGVSIDHLRKIETSVLPVYGVSLDMSSPRFHERVFLHTGILYTKSMYYSYWLEEIGVVFTNRYYTSVEINQLKIPIGFKYQLPGKRIKPFFEIGISSTLNISSSSKLIVETEASNVVRTMEQEAFEIENYQVGYWVGMGVVIPVHKRFDALIDLRVERTNGITNPNFIWTSISNVMISIGIKLK